MSEPVGHNVSVHPHGSLGTLASFAISDRLPCPLEEKPLRAGNNCVILHEEESVVVAEERIVDGLAALMSITMHHNFNKRQQKGVGGPLRGCSNSGKMEVLCQRNGLQYLGGMGSPFGLYIPCNQNQWEASPTADGQQLPTYRDRGHAKQHTLERSQANHCVDRVTCERGQAI